MSCYKISFLNLQMKTRETLSDASTISAQSIVKDTYKKNKSRKEKNDRSKCDYIKFTRDTVDSKLKFTRDTVDGELRTK